MKKLFEIILIVFSFILLTSCNSREDDFIEVKDESKPIEEILDVVEDDNTLLDRQIKEYRTERDKDKYHLKMEEGVGGVLPDRDKIKGLLEISKNIPIHEDANELLEPFEVVNKYIKDNKIKPKTRDITYECVDPRILKIYIDEDRGKLQNYEKDNIFLQEYLDGNIWKYIFVARENKDSNWEVVHVGTDYKE